MRGWGPFVFPAGFMVFAVARASFSLVAGSWTDRLGATRLLAAPTILFAAGLLCLLFSSLALAVLFFLLMGLSFGASGAIFMTAWSDLFGTEKIGLIKGLSSSVGIFATALAPVIFGFLVEAGVGFDIILGICILLMGLLAWPLSFLLWRSLAGASSADSPKSGT